jgi:hypothetical protein
MANNDPQNTKEATTARVFIGWNDHLESFAVATMTWLTVTEYLSQMTTDMVHLS